jgi:hypothetical protein
LAAKSQGISNLADISGVWKGAFYQKNFVNPNDSDLVYKAVMTVEQHGDVITGHCYIFWYDDEHYFGDWQMRGSYDGLRFDYAESEIKDSNCKPGFTWCYKNVQSFVTYNPATARWMITGSFNAHTNYSDCAPGQLIFFKEGDV